MVPSHAPVVAWRDTVAIVFVPEGTAASFCQPSGTREEIGSLVWHFVKVSTPGIPGAFAGVYFPLSDVCAANLLWGPVRRYPRIWLSRTLRWNLHQRHYQKE